MQFNILNYVKTVFNFKCLETNYLEFFKSL